MSIPSICGKAHGNVAWQCSRNEDAAHTENIEIPVSHLGLGVNPLALYAIAERPRQDPRRRQHFDVGAAARRPFRGAQAVH